MSSPGRVTVCPAPSSTCTGCAGLFSGLARRRWRLRPAELTAGGLASSCVNAGNLGVPISVYVLDDASFVAPVPLSRCWSWPRSAWGVLAGSRAQGHSRWRVLLQPLATPVVIGCALGVLVAATGMRLPALVLQPVELTAGLAVPAADPRLRSRLTAAACAPRGRPRR